MLRNNKSKWPQIRLESEASGSLSGNDSVGKSSQTKSDTKVVRPKILQKSKVVSSRYKSAAIEATKKNLSSSSDSSRAISPFDKSRTKIRVGSGLAKSSNFLKPGAGSAEKPNLTLLHSTAVNSSTFLEKTRSSPEEFSTTIVGGQNRFHQNKNSNDTISPLPDISEICRSIPTTVVSAPTDKKLSSQKKIYTKEDLNKEFLEYLIWTHIDKRSEQAFDKQVKEAQKQISCLSQLLEQEEEETAEVRQKLKLLNRFERSARLHEGMKDQLLTLNETVEPCDKAIEDLSRHLEFQMSQIKLENIYIPSDESNYKEKLTESIMTNCDILTELNSNVENTKNFFQSASSLFEDVVDEAGKIESVLSLGEKVAALKIQESSLKLYQMEKDRIDGLETSNTTLINAV